MKSGNWAERRLRTEANNYIFWITIFHSTFIIIQFLVCLINFLNVVVRIHNIILIFKF